MSYRVLYAEQFRNQLDEQLTYLEHEGAPKGRISDWLNELLALMDSLDESPLRYPIAAIESGIEGIELRRVVFGRYLIFYRVEEAQQEVQGGRRANSHREMVRALLIEGHTRSGANRGSHARDTRWGPAQQERYLNRRELHVRGAFALRAGDGPMPWRTRRQQPGRARLVRSSPPAPAHWRTVLSDRVRA